VENIKHNGRKTLWQNTFIVAIGYILSPLSWWNDAIVNLPLAYAFSVPFSYISEQLYMPSFVLGYWLTNLLGFILMHQGATNMFRKKHKQTSLLKVVLISTIYTLLIIALVYNNWLDSPTAYL